VSGRFIDRFPLDWSLEEVRGYILSWSAVRASEAAGGGREVEAALGANGVAVGEWTAASGDAAFCPDGAAALISPACAWPRTPSDLITGARP
jgi:hypothetical protein